MGDDGFMRWASDEMEKWSRGAMVQRVHLLDVYQFVYALNGEGEQCLEVLSPMSVCLELDEEEMTVRVSRGGDERGLKFSDDEDWHTVDEITAADTVLEKCVWMFEAKVCVQCQDETEFTLLVHKAAV